MVAIIETGGKQYCVEPGQKLEVNRLATQVGESVTFENLLGGTSVKAEVLKHVLGDKVVIRNFRNKVRSHKTKGHRQPLTVIMIHGEGNKSAVSASTPKIEPAESDTKEA